jgi:hypothetical protein
MDITDLHRKSRAAGEADGGFQDHTIDHSVIPPHRHFMRKSGGARAMAREPINGALDAPTKPGVT